MDEPQNGLPNPDSLRVQLSELNIRGRWYTSQLWQLPFAYFGVSGLVIGQSLIRATTYLPALLLAAGVLGLFVIWHMIGLLNGQKRSVLALQETEAFLGLKQTALYKPLYSIPLITAVLAGVCAYFGFGLFLLSCIGCLCLS